MIRIRGLTKRYGPLTVLDDVSLDVAPGTSMALWGHNGAGKTTIIRSILGLARYDGTVEVAGFDATNEGIDARRQIGHVPQDLSFHEHLSVAEIVDFSRELTGTAVTRARDVLHMVDLEEEVAKKVGALSGGMRQRLAIGLALLSDPPLLLLDEPTSNLDAESREKAIHLLQGLRAEKTILLTTHHAGEVGLLADTVTHLENGKIVFTGSPAELDERGHMATWLHLTIAPDAIPRAIDLLHHGAIDARRNGTGLLIEGSARAKGAALGILTAAGITIDDVEVWR